MHKLGGMFFFLKYPQNPTTLPESLKQFNFPKISGHTSTVTGATSVRTNDDRGDPKPTLGSLPKILWTQTFVEDLSVCLQTCFGSAPG